VQHRTTITIPRQRRVEDAPWIVHTYIPAADGGQKRVTFELTRAKCVFFHHDAKTKSRPVSWERLAALFVERVRPTNRARRGKRQRRRA